jgi:protein SCO1/2
MRTPTIIALLVTALGLACSRTPPPPTYQLTGQVLAVRPATNEILVKHDDIPGFMPAMTMPYTVKDPALLKDRAVGDLITATLVVDAGLPHLSAITKTGSAPVPDDAPKAIPVAAGVTLLKYGDAVPDTSLVDQDERPITLQDFRGFATAVTFIYTRCPLAQFCPLLDRRFAEVQKLAAASPMLRGKIRLLSISFDPQFDRASVLKAHAKKVGADPQVWRFATADAPVVDRLAATFGINVIREQDGTITHNLRTAIIDPSGHISRMLDNNAWTAEDLLRALSDGTAAAR